MDTLRVTYSFSASPADAESFAGSLLIEQTVETPLSVAHRYPFVREHMTGKIETLERIDEHRHRVTLSLPTVTASVDAAQFLNVLFGNGSLHDGVTLEDFVLPGTLPMGMKGPRHGIEGWRALTGVRARPLVCSALKPVGVSLDELERLVLAFAEGGIDAIKDDHYLADHPFAPFEQRVERIERALDRFAERTGRRPLYIPNLSGTPDEVRRQAETAQRLGARAVMIAPMLLGLPFLHELTAQHLDVPLLAHPSFGGNGLIRPAVLIGKLFRLYGADAVIFPGYGGRFSVSKETCAAIADTAREPWSLERDGTSARFHRALPVPAGGMTRERAAELVAFYGHDVMLLVGGSLLEAGNDLPLRTRELMEHTQAAARTLSPSPDA